MATLTVRIGDVTKAQLEELARAQGQTLSDLVRSTLENLVRYPDGVTGEAVARDSVAPRSLSLVERQILALQHRILAHVMPADHGDAPTEDCARVEGDPQCQRQRAQILEEGYVGEYPTVFVSTEPELPAGESELVMDLLDMFRVITFSIQRIRTAGTEIDDDLERRLAFRGFDVQEPGEARLLRYMRYLVNDDRWPEMAPSLGSGHDYGNSHSPTRSRYERLLAEYNRIRDERGSLTGADAYLLTFDQLERLATVIAPPGSTDRRARRSGSATRPNDPSASGER